MQGTAESIKESERWYDDRLRSRKRAVREYLSDRKWHLNTELAQPHVGGHSFNVHIKSLRHDGYKITSEKVEEGIWRYRMIGKGEPVKLEKTMSVRQEAVAEDYVKGIVSEFGAEGLGRVLGHVREHYRVDGHGLV